MNNIPDYEFSIDEEMKVMLHEAKIFEDIEKRKFNKDDFLKRYLPYVLEGLEVSDEYSIYGNSELAESLLLVDCLMRHPAESKEAYMEHLQRNEAFESFMFPDDILGADRAAYYNVLKKMDNNYVTESYITKHFGLAYPLETDENVKKLIERIYDKILEGFGRDFHLSEEATETPEAKRKTIRYLLIARYRTYHELLENNKGKYFFYNSRIYSNDFSGGLLGSLSANNIFLFLNQEDAHEFTLLNRAAEKAIDDYIKHFIITLCFKRIAENRCFTKENTEFSFGEKDKFLASIKDEVPDILEMKYNIFNIKKYINETSADFLLQGILSTTIIIFMKYLAQDDFLEREKKKLTKEYANNDDMCFIHKDEWEKLQKKNTELEQDIDKKQEKILELTEKYGALPDDIQGENKKLKKENNDYRKEVYALKKQIESLQAEKEVLENPAPDIAKQYQTFSVQPEEEIEFLDEVEEEKTTVVTKSKEVPEYIYTKKYIFLCTRDEIALRLEKRFPNSIVSTDYEIKEVNAGTIDGVICLVRDISHSNYFAFKQKCKSMNIPFIDCNCKNTERIAQEIYNFGIKE